MVFSDSPLWKTGPLKASAWCSHLLKHPSTKGAIQVSISPHRIFSTARMLLNPGRWQKTYFWRQLFHADFELKYHCFQFVSLKTALDIDMTISCLFYIQRYMKRYLSYRKSWIQYLNRNVKNAVLPVVLHLDTQMVAKLAWITGTSTNDVTTEGEVRLRNLG